MNNKIDELRTKAKEIKEKAKKEEKELLDKAKAEEQKIYAQVGKKAIDFLSNRVDKNELIRTAEKYGFQVNKTEEYEYERTTHPKTD